jgi:hypothetical protein
MCFNRTHSWGLFVIERTLASVIGKTVRNRLFDVRDVSDFAQKKSDTALHRFVLH